MDSVLKYDDEARLASVNLDVKNPNGKADLEHVPPSQLVEDIIAKELKILEILKEMKAALGGRRYERLAPHPVGKTTNPV